MTSQARQVVAYVFDCAACQQPLVDPEYGDPILFHPNPDGSPPDLSNYDQDACGFVHLDSGEYVHDGPGQCWHWCQDDDLMGKGPDNKCPNGATHAK